MHINDIHATIIECLESVDSNFENVAKWRIVFGTVALTTGVIWLQDFINNRNEYLAEIRSQGFQTLKKIPAVRKKLEEELTKSRREMESSIYEPEERSMKIFLELPDQGLSHENVLKLTKEVLKLGKYNWKDGKVSGGVQQGKNQEYTTLIGDVYKMCAWTNPLHADIFPGTRKMETEIVKMTINMFNGDENAVGTMTTGGTESLMVMLKAYRNWGKEEKGILHAEIIAANTVHAAVDKGADFFGMKLKKVGINKKTGKMDLDETRRAITGNTVLLIGSAPEYAHGIMDDIESLAKIASKNGIGMHVDCCLGGFIFPFMAEAGFPLDPFDFTVPGVTSISADTHKYGNCPKGSSVIMYHDKKYIHHQYFTITSWPGGIYATPAVCGSRAGANIAVCWTALTYFGRDGYVNTTKAIITIARSIKQELRKLPELFVFGDPMGPVVSFGSDTLNVYKLADVMCDKGWHLQPLQHPRGIHIFLTSLHVRDKIVEELIQDLKSSIDMIKKDPSEVNKGIAKLYGMAHSLPDKSIIEDAAKVYLDVYYSPVKQQKSPK